MFTLLMMSHILLRMLTVGLLRLSPSAPVYLTSLIFDVSIIIPFAFLSYLGLYSSLLAVTLAISYSWLLFLGATLRVDLNHAVFSVRFRERQMGLICLFASLAYLTGVLHQNLQYVNSFNFNSLMSAAGENSTARYSSELNLSPLYKFGVIFAFASAVLNGVRAASLKGLWGFSSAYLLFFVSICDSLLMGARAGFMLILLTFLGSRAIFLSRVEHNKTSSLILFVKVAGGLFLIFSFFLLIQLARGGLGIEDISRISKYILTWFVGQASAFSVWIDGPKENTGLSLGIYTFAGPAEVLGLAASKGGVYEMAYIGSGRYSNVFTALRGMILDFGMFGSFVMIFLFSFLYGETVKARNFHFWTTFFISISLWTFFSWAFVVSPWNYSSLIAGQILGVLLCKLNTKVIENV